MTGVQTCALPIYRRLPIASKQQKDAAAKRNAEVDAIVKKQKADLTALKKQFTDRLFEDRLAELPEGMRDDVKAALNGKKSARTEAQKRLAEKFEKQLRPQAKELDAALAKYVEYVKGAKDLNATIAAEERRRLRFDEVRALYDLPGEANTPVLLRGDVLTPGPLVTPGVISALETPQPFEWVAPAAGAKTSGRRLAFARWLTQPQHPLTARVMVNRIWMHHFGTGIVATVDDFGVAGSQIGRAHV